MNKKEQEKKLQELEPKIKDIFHLLEQFSQKLSCQTIQEGEKWKLCLNENKINMKTGESFPLSVNAQLANEAVAWYQGASFLFKSGKYKKIK